MLARVLSSIVSQPIIGEDRLIAGLAIDSRKVEKDYLFVAVKGEQEDGHQYIRQAIANGAAAVALENPEFICPDEKVSFVSVPGLKAEVGHIASRFYGHPSEKLAVIGVTGTNGKTSITHYIASLLKLLGRDCAVIGTLGIAWQGKQVATGNTTPDAVTLQKTFRQLVQEGIGTVAMEVSSHALDQQRCAGIRFDTAIISNVTHDHLDYHGSFDAYMSSKVSLFCMPGLRVAVINADDASAGLIRAAVPASVKLISYSAKNSQADIYLSEVNCNANGYSATLHYQGKDYPFSVGLLGDFNLYNALAAIIALVEQGHDMVAILQAAAQLQGVAGRMQLVPNSRNIIAVVDYAHTPDALENVLQSLRRQVSGRIIVVFGCGGDRDREKRPKMAAIAERLADYVVLTADNPRSESVEKIIGEMQAGMHGIAHALEPDRAKAVALAVTMASAGDCVLVAGKGHEKTQVAGGVVLPFDDVAVLVDAMDRREELSC